MARKVFISFLGNNDYLETHYQFADGTLSKPVRFIQEALIAKYCGDWTEDDHIYIFYTGGEEGSYTMNWKDYGQKQNPTAIGLENCLKALQLKTPVEGTSIPEGFSIDEIWSIFDIVYGKLQEKDEIYFDVTHAFRSIPMFSMVLFNYAQFMLLTQIKAINYGAFEKLGPKYKVKEMPLDQRIAPVLNLMPLVELQQYTDIASSLITFGRLNKLGDTLSDDNMGEASSVVKQIRKGIEEFDTDLLANRMPNIKSGKSIIKIRNSVKTASESPEIPKPIKRVIQRLNDELSGFVPYESNQNIEAAIEWAVKYKMLPQAYTLGQEYIISLVAERLANRNPYHSKKRNQDAKNFRMYISSLCSIPEEDVTKEDFRGEMLKYVELAKELLATDFINALRKPFAALGANRNAVNHAKGEISYEKLAKEFNDVYGNCLQLCKQKNKLFINLTNHPSAQWNDEQKAAAEAYGEIIDMPFPSIDANSGEEEIAQLADAYMDEIVELQKNHTLTVHLMGEFTFCSALLKRLQAADIRCVASCTQRISAETEHIKTSVFKFVKFRNYE